MWQGVLATLHNRVPRLGNALNSLFKVQENELKSN